MEPKPKLTIADYEAAAKKLNCQVAAVRAVFTVESSGSGFDKNGRVIIRFEPHKFSFRTKGVYDKTHPQLSFPTWKPGYPVSVDQSWSLFKQAAALNPAAAVWSTSWGGPQILGQNYISCGCDSLTEFVARMERSEADQLDMFCELIIDWELDDELQRLDWSGFARIYNGKGYKINRYDSRMNMAFLRYGGKPLATI